jgi:hypothetical protein
MNKQLCIFACFYFCHLHFIETQLIGTWIQLETIAVDSENNPISIPDGRCDHIIQPINDQYLLMYGNHQT